MQRRGVAGRARRVAVHDRSAIEWVNDRFAALDLDPQQEVPRREQPAGINTVRPRRVNINDAKRHRQPAPAFNDVEKIGTFRIIEIGPLAFIAITAGDDRGERIRRTPRIADEHEFRPDGFRDFGKMGAVRRKFSVRLIERRKLQRCSGKIMRAITGLPQFLQIFRRRSFRVSHNDRAQLIHS